MSRLVESTTIKLEARSYLMGFQSLVFNLLKIIVSSNTGNEKSKIISFLISSLLLFLEHFRARTWLPSTSAVGSFRPGGRRWSHLRTHKVNLVFPVNTHVAEFVQKTRWDKIT